MELEQATQYWNNLERSKKELPVYMSYQPPGVFLTGLRLG